MKIALVRKEYTRSWGGAEGYVVNLSSQLCELGHEVHVFAHTWEKPSDPRITFHRVPMLSFYSPLKNLSFAWNVRRMIKKETFDLIYGLSQIYPQDVYRMGDGLHRHFLHTRFPLRFSRWLHSLNPRHLVLLFIERQIFKPQNYYGIIANSVLCKKQAVRYYQVPEEKIEVIYNGVDLERFNPAVRKYRSSVRGKLGIKEQDTVILFVSRNFERKGLRTLIQSLPHLGEVVDAVKVVVVGRGNPSPYQHLARRLGMEGLLLFVGEEQIVERYYGASDVLVLPTLYDPFSNVCLEALACGLPVITSRSNGAAELIEEGKNGYIIEDARDERGLAEKIELYLAAGDREEMGRNAAHRARDFTITRNAEQTVAFCEKVRARKNPFPFSFHNNIIINDGYRRLLSRNKLLDFTTLMHYPEGRMVKSKEGIRSTVRIGLKEGNGEIGAYLKRFQPPDVKVWIASLIRLTLPRTARDEWDSIRAFLAHGIPTMIPLAAGVRGGGIRIGESFLLTREIEGVERLEDLLPRYFTPPLSQSQVVEKRTLIRELACQVRKMHCSGMNHRDLYLCHVLVRRDSYPRWQFYFVDLHRVDRRTRVGWRWKVKDLAALNYSAQREIITSTDRLRFIISYWGEERLCSPAKKLIKKVIQKTERIRSHDVKHQKKG